MPLGARVPVGGDILAPLAQKCMAPAADLLLPGDDGVIENICGYQEVP
jgi:hypothetical protein